MTDAESTAISLANAWEMGMRDEVLIFLRREPPLRAAYIALAILGFLTAGHGKAKAHEFIEALGEAADQGQTSN